MHLHAEARSAIKSLLASRGTTAAAAITVALGVGAFTAVFAIADGVLIKPLPYAAPDRLVAITTERAVDGNDIGMKLSASSPAICPRGGRRRSRPSSCSKASDPPGPV